MKHLAAYLLLQMGGNKNPSKDDITKALGSVGIGVDEDRLDQLLADLQGKDLEEILEQGQGMLATFGGDTTGDGDNVNDNDDTTANQNDKTKKQAPVDEDNDSDVEDPMEIQGPMLIFDGGEDDSDGDY